MKQPGHTLAAMITYQRVRVLGHIAAALAGGSFIRGIMLYKGDVSPAKIILFLMLLAGWLVILPLVGCFWEVMPRSNKILDFKYAAQKFVGRILFPPVIIGAFLWMTATTWGRNSNEYTLRHIFNEITNSSQKYIRSR